MQLTREYGEIFIFSFSQSFDKAKTMNLDIFIRLMQNTLDLSNDC